MRSGTCKYTRLSSLLISSGCLGRAVEEGWVLGLESAVGSHRQEQSKDKSKE